MLNCGFLSAQTWSAQSQHWPDTTGANTTESATSAQSTPAQEHPQAVMRAVSNTATDTTTVTAAADPTGGAAQGDYSQYPGYDYTAYAGYGYYNPNAAYYGNAGYQYGAAQAYAAQYYGSSYAAHAG